jgi:high-affinity nickel permease
MGVLQLALQFNFWIAVTIWNSSYFYFYVVSVFEQITWVVKVVTHHIYNAIHCNSIAIVSK